MSNDDPFAGVASAPVGNDPFAGVASIPARTDDAAEQAGSSPDQQLSRFLQEHFNPNAIAMKARSVGYSGLDPDERQFIDQQYGSSQASKSMTLDQAHKAMDARAGIIAENPSLSALMPATADALAEGRGYPERMLASGKDLLTLVPRTAAGIGNGLGELAGSLIGGASLGDALRGSGDAYMQGLRSPVDAAQESSAYAPWMQQKLANPGLYASMAEDPLTMASVAIPALAESRLGAPLGRLGEGAIASGMSYGRNVADRLMRGDESPFAESPGQTLADAAPLGLSVMGPVAAEVAGGLGSKLMGAGNEMFRKMVKPAPMKNGGAEVEGLNQALEAGLLPKLAGFGLSVGGAGRRYLGKVLPAIGEQYPAALEGANATGKTVNANDVLRETIDRLAESGASRSDVMAPGDAGKAAYWVGDYLTAPQQESAYRASMFGAEPAGAVAKEVELLPSQAHRMKSALAEQAFSRDPSETTPLYARLLANKFASAILRRRLGDISPEYAALNEKAAPYYAAEDAMIRAASTGGNRNLLSLGTLLHPLASLQEAPIVARGLWEAGSGMRGLGGYVTPLSRGIAPALSPLLGTER